MQYNQNLKGFKFNLHKAYFNQGLSLLNQVKYIVLFLGGGNLIATGGNPKFAIILYSIYAVVCYLLGRWWHVHGYRESEIEVSNRYNLFVKEVRERKVI